LGIAAGCSTGGISGLNSIEISGGTINAAGTGVSGGSAGIGTGWNHSYCNNQQTCRNNQQTYCNNQQTYCGTSTLETENVTVKSLTVN
jgi:D-arabinose 1-dehydrogenase-like Zn-dependent alcohol dehydrogenase